MFNLVTLSQLNVLHVVGSLAVCARTSLEPVDGLQLDRCQDEAHGAKRP